MTRVLSIRLSVDEEAYMRRTMEIAGETQIGPHMKRVYFGTLNPREGVLAEIRRDQELTLHMLMKLAKAEKNKDEFAKVDEQPADRLPELKMLAAIYTMLHMSINKDARLIIDRFINKKAIDNFLNSDMETK